MKHQLDHMRPFLMLFLSAHRTKLVAGVALASITVVAGLLLLGLSGWFVTATALAGRATVTAYAFDIFTPSAGIRFLALVRTASRYGERLVTHDATLRVLAALRVRLFRSWAAPQRARELLLRPARLLFRLTVDVDALDTLYPRVVVPGLAAVASTLVFGFALALIDPRVGVAAACFLLAVGGGLLLAGGLMAVRPNRRRMHALAALRARTVDLVAGQTDFLMTGYLDTARGGICRADDRLAVADDALNRIETGVGFGFGVASAVLTALLLLAVGALAQTGAIEAPIAAFVVLAGLACLEPFALLRRGAMELGRALFAMRRLAPALKSDGTTEEPVCRFPSADGGFRLDGVSFRHPGAGAHALRNVTLRVAAGEHVALIGTSGAGKSSVIRLIAGEFSPLEGCLEAVSSTLMTQVTELFQDSLRGNLQLADPAASDARLWEVLEAAGLAPDIHALPGGLDTQLGEGGTGLSGGQMRRLALARLLLSDTPLWLLDEPTESIDRETARDLLAKVKALAYGRGLVIATHIRREAELADRLIALDEGVVKLDVRRGDEQFEALLEGLRTD